MNNTNPLEDSLRHLFRQLNAVYGILFHLEDHLQNYVAAIREKLGGLPAQSSDMFVGTSVVVEDLTYSSSQGVWRCYSSGKFFTEGEEYLEIATEIVSRNAVWAVAQGWERFESYLFDVTAAFWADRPHEVEQGKYKKFLSKQGLSSATTLSEWKQFVRMYRGRNNVDLFKYLRSVAPHLSIGEASNSRNIDLVAWYKLAAAVRHAVTHSGDLIPPDTVKELISRDSSARMLMDLFFPGDLQPDGYRLQLKVGDVSAVLEVFASYAFLVFKALSLRGGYDWDILERKKLAKASEAPNTRGLNRPAPLRGTAG